MQTVSERYSAKEYTDNRGAPLKMIIPTGRIQEKVVNLLDRIGVKFSTNATRMLFWTRANANSWKNSPC